MQDTEEHILKGLKSSKSKLWETEGQLMGLFFNHKKKK